MKYLYIIIFLSSSSIIQAAQKKAQEIVISEKRSLKSEKKKPSDKEQVKAIITGVHVRVFSKNILLTEKITREESDTWYEMLKQVESFVQDNDPTLMADYRTLVDASNTIINTLKITFNRSIVPALKNPADKNTGTSHLRDIDLAQVPLKSIEEQIHKLKPTRETLKALQIKLKPSKLGLLASKKAEASNNAKEVLRHLAFILEVTCDKIFIDFKKLSNPPTQIFKA